MSDRIFLRLNEDFALGADSLQWILYRRHSRKGCDGWEGVSFVRSTKAILLRCIREKGCFPDGTAATALDALPDTFDAWKLANTNSSKPPVGTLEAVE
jgi:hypothetical protein